MDLATALATRVGATVWMSYNGGTVPLAPRPIRPVGWLDGAAGKVFDASNAAGKFVLLSADDGVCAVITEQAGERETVKGLEDALRGARAMFRMVIERDDKLNPALHHREYLATKGNRAWRILIATKRDGKAGETPGRAMLTAAPE